MTEGEGVTRSCLGPAAAPLPRHSTSSTRRPPSRRETTGQMSPNEHAAAHDGLAHTAGAHYSFASHSPLDPENFADRHIGIDVPGLAAMLESLAQRDLNALEHAVVPKAIRFGPPLDP